MKKACDFLLKAQREDGGIGDPSMASYDNYFTSSSLMALSIVNDPAHAGAREKMKAFLLTLQRKEEGRLKGGFGYNTSKGADLSNAQFAIEALRSTGLPEDHPAMVEARSFLSRAQNRSENEDNKDASYDMEEKGVGAVKVVPGVQRRVGGLRAGRLQGGVEEAPGRNLRAARLRLRRSP